MAHLKRTAVHRQPFLGHSPRWHAERRARERAQRDPVMQAMYDSPAWKLLRAQCIAEAGGRCATPHCPRIATRADHKVPHRGDHALFFDAANLQALCERCHNRKTPTYDGGFGNPRRVPGA